MAVTVDGHTGGHNGGAVLSMRGKIEAHDCDFIGGTAGQAGALYLFLYASLSVSNSHFVGNRALSIANHSWASGTGGAIFMDRGAASIVNSTFEANVADLAGGALYAWNAHSKTNVTVLGGSFLNNRAKTQWGGAVSNWHSTVVVNGSRFDGNSAAVMAVDGRRVHQQSDGVHVDRQQYRTAGRCGVVPPARRDGPGGAQPICRGHGAAGRRDRTMVCAVHGC